MEALNSALRDQFAGAFPTAVSGGFFATLTLENISPENEAAFINAAKQAGVGVAAAWDAVAPDRREATRRKGLFIRLTFPAFEPERIEWGVTMLKETVDGFTR